MSGLERTEEASEFLASVRLPEEIDLLLNEVPDVLLFIKNLKSQVVTGNRLFMLTRLGEHRDAVFAP